MTRGLGKRISVTIFGAVLIVGGFVFKPGIVSAAVGCCVYSVDPATKPPAWLTSMGDGSLWFDTGAVGTKCKKPSEIVVLSVKKIDKYYKISSENDDDFPYNGSCTKTPYNDLFTYAASKTSCCQVNNSTGILRSCNPVDKALVASTGGFASSCLVATAKQFFAEDDQLIAHDAECTAVAPCQALQQKKDDMNSSNAGLLAKTLAEDKAKADQAKLAAAGARPVWTKQECEAVKMKSGELAFVWIAPKNTPNAQLGDFCYIRQLPTNLQVDIGSTSVIAGLPTYINVLYKYALGIGVIVMIIVIMFSGIQWMLSGIASSINDSKARIQNAALGLLLLMGANTILYTINPQLLNLKLPPMHAIRPEKFDVPVATNQGKRCDPSEKDACATMGAKFKCMPTGYYASDKCLKQLNGFMAVTFGGAAIAAIGPFLLPAGGVASVTEAGAGQLLKKVAIEVAEDQVLNVATGGKVNGAEAATDAVGAAGGTKAKLVIGGLAILTGLAVAANLYADAEEAKNPALGYCVELKPDKADYSVCQYDGQCVSNKCLITSAGQCGAGHFGVCVSGELRQACLLPETYKKGLLEFAQLGASVVTGGAAANFIDLSKFTNEDLAKHYGCKNSITCVNNGRGAALDGIGVCSDGSDIGMACDSNVSCKSATAVAGQKLACIKGYCREAAYFSSSFFGNKGLWIDSSKTGPRCLMPTDCNDASIMALHEFQNTYMVGCLKNPSTELHLPARMLLAQTNGIIDKNFYQELSSYGRCVTDQSYWVSHADKTNASSAETKVEAPCFINIYPDKGWNKPETSYKDYNFGFPSKYAAGFKIRRVGCGCSKAQDVFGFGKDECSSTPGICTAPITSVIDAAKTYASENFISVEGTCEYNNYQNSKDLIKLTVKSKSNAEHLYAGESDGWNNGIRFPDIIDVQYTFAGEAKGATIFNDVKP